MLKAHSRLFEHLTLAADLALIGGCWMVAYWIRFWGIGGSDIPAAGHYALQLVPILIVWTFAFHAFDLYRPSRLHSHLSEWLDVAKASTLGVLGLGAVMAFLFPHHPYSRLVIAIFWALSIVTVSLWRAAFREILRFARRRGYNQRYAVIVGGGDLATELLGVLRRRRDVGINVVGVLSDKRDVPDGTVKWLGGLEDLRRVLDTHQIDQVFIALPLGEHPRLAAVLNDIGDDPVAIHVVPDVRGVERLAADVLGRASLRAGREEFETVPLIHLRESPLYGWSRFLKRVIDLGLGSVALLCAGPVMMAITAAIRLTSPGPVLYRQERMGLDGQRFFMLKFRSMHVDAEAKTGPVWAREHDPRRTRFGAFLRRWSLDELPQLWNVLRGEMSLVGPRPERPSFVEEFRRQVPSYMLRHKIKAGITGWAQVNGWRGNTSIEKRIECDLYYIDNWSLGFDLKILILTVLVGFKNRNAY